MSGFAGVCFGTAAGAGAGGVGALAVAVSSSLNDDDMEALDAATRCKALPSLRSLVIKFPRCNWADGRVMCCNAASISSASRRRSWDRESAALLGATAGVGCC